jgi:long-chain acyl-CoA synthetase
MRRQSINDLFRYAVSHYDKPNALMFKRNGLYESIPSRKFHDMVKQTAAALAELGIRKGDRIGILSENRPEWAVADLGILANGAVNVPVYASLPSNQIEYLAQHAGVRLIFVSTLAQLEKILQIRRALPSLEKIVLLDGVPPPTSEVTPFCNLIDSGRVLLQRNPSIYEELCEKVEPDDLASIIYTSGTTGIPKGVMLSYVNIVSNVLSCAKIFDIDSSDLVLTFLPLCHIFERMADYLMIYCGATIAYAENPEAVPQNMLDVRPTIVPSVPRLFEKMYLRLMDTINSSSPLKKRFMRWAIAIGREFSRRTLASKQVGWSLSLKNRVASRLVFSKLAAKLGGRLRFFISGGAPLDEDLAEFYHGLEVLIFEGYGLTETSPVIAVNQPNQFKFGSVGKPIDGVEVTIAADGEILTRGPSVMLGYYRMEEETREAFEGDWLRTGDIGFLDEDGFLHVTDRKKDLIVTASGKNVAPQKIEGVLKKCPYLLNVVAIGDRRPYISALVVPNPEKLIEYARERRLIFRTYPELLKKPEINQFLLGQIASHMSNFAHFEQVRRIALLEKDFTIDAGELTPSLKVRRRVVEIKYRDMIEELYAPVYQPT